MKNKHLEDLIKLLETDPNIQINTHERGSRAYKLGKYITCSEFVTNILVDIINNKGYTTEDLDNISHTMFNHVIDDKFVELIKEETGVVMEKAEAVAMMMVTIMIRTLGS